MNTKKLALNTETLRRLENAETRSIEAGVPAMTLAEGCVRTIQFCSISLILGC